MLWLLTLPFRLAIKLLVCLVVLPLVFVALCVAGLVTVFAVSLAVLIPLAPFALGALFIWALVRILSPRPSIV